MKPNRPIFGLEALFPMSSRFLLIQAAVVGAYAANLAGQTLNVVPSEISAAPKFHVIQQKRVQAGGRTIVFNRIAPPILPTKAVGAAVEQSEIQVQLEQKPIEFVLLSATVYDRQVTELVWFADGRTFHAFSNIDFNYIAGLGEFQTAVAIYSLILGIGNETSAVLADANREAEARGWPQKVLPDLGQFPQGYSSYLVAPDSATEASGFAAMEALHAYYDANREQLERAYAQREAARIEQERLRATQSAKPKDTVIYFWPKKSALYKGEEAAKAR